MMKTEQEKRAVGLTTSTVNFHSPPPSLESWVWDRIWLYFLRNCTELDEKSDFFVLSLFILRERECMRASTHTQVGEGLRERGKERIPSRLRAVSSEPKGGAQSQKL